MKTIGYLLGACIALAVLKAVIVAALTLGGLLIIWGTYHRPYETFTLLIIVLLYGLFAVQPLACLSVVAVAYLVIRLAPQRQLDSRQGKRLPPH